MTFSKEPGFSVIKSCVVLSAMGAANQEPARLSLR